MGYLFTRFMGSDEFGRTRLASYSISMAKHPMSGAPITMIPRISFWQNEAEFDDLLLAYRQEADRIMLLMCVFLQATCLALSPLHNTWFASLTIGFSTLFTGYMLCTYRCGALITRLFMGCAFMTYTALIIHQTASTEGHFSAFGLIGCLLFYRDWRTIAAATLYIYLHHLVFGYAQVVGLPVFVFETTAYWQNFSTHVLYFLPFVSMMSYLAIALRRQGVDAEHVRRLATAIASGDISHRLEQTSLDNSHPLLVHVIAMRNRLMELIQLMPVAIMVVRVDTQQVVATNHRWIALFSANSTHVNQLVDTLSIWTMPEQWKSILDAFDSPNTITRELQGIPLRKNDENLLLASLSMMLHREGSPQMLIIAIEDITKRHAAESALRKLAYEDLLTGLANRANLHEDIARRLANLKQQQLQFALLLLDLDGFKAINDTYGHDVGDEVLKIASHRLSALCRENDSVARLGGDEFCVILDQCDNIPMAGHMATRIIETISQPIKLKNGIFCNIGVSIGIALGHVSHDFSTLLNEADKGLYVAKGAGKTCWRYFIEHSHSI